MKTTFKYQSLWFLPLLFLTLMLPSSCSMVQAAALTSKTAPYNFVLDTAVLNLKPYLFYAQETQDRELDQLLMSHLAHYSTLSRTYVQAAGEPYSFLKVNQHTFDELKVKKDQETLTQLQQQVHQFLHESFPKRTDFIVPSGNEIFDYAREIEEKYGVEIDYGQDVLNYWFDSAKPTSSMSPSLFNALAILDEELAKYPRDIFYTDLTHISISLVAGYEDLGESLKGEEIEGLAQKKEPDLTYRNHQAEYYMSLKINTPNFRSNIHHELGHLLAFRIDPNYTSGMYEKFQELFDPLPSTPQFLSQGADPMTATHLTQYHAHDNHEYLSILFSAMILNNESQDYFPEGSFLAAQAQCFRDLVIHYVPRMSEFTPFVTLNGSVDYTPPAAKPLSEQINYLQGLLQR